MADLQDIDNIGPSYATQLADAGFDTVEAVANAEPDELDAVIDRLNGETIVENASELLDEEQPETLTLAPGFTVEQTHHLIRALVREETEAHRRNDPDRADVVQDATEQVINGEPYEMTLEQLNVAFTGVNQLKNEYRSTRGLTSMSAMILEVRDTFRDARTELFDQ